MPSANSIVDVSGILIGHATDQSRLTGCTVVLCPSGATAAADVRGGAPGTRETDLLGPGRLVQQVHAVVLAGGSAFGLAAADGVVRYLVERGYGWPVGNIRVPIVPAAILFDLGIGDPRAYPDASAGWQAAQSASSDRPEVGCVGAGTGAAVGKVLGINRGVKSGIGSAAIRLDGGATVGAIVAVNALGDVISPVGGQILAGSRDPNTDEYLSAVSQLIHAVPSKSNLAGTNTTIGVVATDAALSRDELVRVAAAAHDGLARVVRPAHTLYDGDTFFALATGQSRAKTNPVAVAVAAGEVVATAIVQAIMAATPLGGLPIARAAQRPAS